VEITAPTASVQLRGDASSGKRGRPCLAVIFSNSMLGKVEQRRRVRSVIIIKNSVDRNPQIRSVSLSTWDSLRPIEKAAAEPWAETTKFGRIRSRATAEAAAAAAARRSGRRSIPTRRRGTCTP
jgi:hypothetical protein